MSNEQSPGSNEPASLIEAWMDEVLLLLRDDGSTDTLVSLLAPLRVTHKQVRAMRRDYLRFRRAASGFHPDSREARPSGVSKVDWQAFCEREYDRRPPSIGTPGR